MTYRVGTYINLKKQTRRQKMIAELENTAFWVVAIGLFIYCLLG